MGKKVIFKIFVLAKRKIESWNQFNLRVWSHFPYFFATIVLFLVFANFNEKKQEILWANMPRVCKEISSSQDLWRNTAFFFGIILLLLPKWTDTWDGIFFLLVEWVNVVLIFWNVGLIWRSNGWKTTDSIGVWAILSQKVGKNLTTAIFRLSKNLIFLTNILMVFKKNKTSK